MANKKRQRKRSASSRPRAAGATSTANRKGHATKADRDSDAPVAVRPAPATPGGPNRLERKEAARQYRERLRRKAVRARVYRRAGIGSLVVAVIAGIVFLATKQASAPQLTKKESQLLAQAPQALVSAGCGEVVKTKDYPNGADRTHIGQGDFPTPPPLSTYPSIPPASGPHNPNPEPAGVYSDPPDIYQTIHSLEHAGVIIWYRPSATSNAREEAELTKLTAFFQEPNETDDSTAKVIVAPYNFPDQGAQGQLPAGKDMVLVAWHRVRSCDQISLAAAYDFAAHYRFPPPKGEKYLGAAPEKLTPL